MTNFAGVLNPVCGHSFSPTPEVFLSYFNQTPLSCVCGDAIQVWDRIRDCFVGVGATFNLLAPIGGQNLISTLTLQNGELFTLDMATLGIEASDVVTMVNFTFTSEDASDDGSFSALVPAMLFGNSVPTKTKLEHEMVIFPMPMGPKPPHRGTFSLYIHYIEEQREVHRALLLDAVRAHGEEDYKRSIMYAHTAADTALDNALSRLLGAREPGKLRSEVNMGFRGKLQSLALVRASAGLPELSPKFVQFLYDLNAHRNKVAHPPKSNLTMNQESMADLLTAALFLVVLAEADFAFAP